MSELEPDSGYERLESQIRWYDTKSMSSQRFYKRTKVVSLALAALVPLFAFLNPILTAVSGAGIVILESLSQLNQWAQTWITYRSTCEALRHEKYSFLGRSGIYASAANDEEAKKMLVARVEALISTEHAKWIANQEYTIKSLHPQAADKH
jgi:hypothetical protein